MADLSLFIYLIQFCFIHLVISLGTRHEGATGEDIYDVYKGYRIFKTKALNASQALALEKYGELWDFWKYPLNGSSSHIFIAPYELTSVRSFLKKARIQYEEIPWKRPLRQKPIEDIEPRNLSYTDYHNLCEIYMYLDNLADVFPKWVTVLNIASSSTNRVVRMLKISMSHKTARRPAVVIVSGIHGREWVAPPVALYAIFQLVENYKYNIHLVDSLDWYVVPILNPDGYTYSFEMERFWKKTRSFNGFSECFGVDLDRNSFLQWNTSSGSNDPCSPMFQGYDPFSEVELGGFAEFIYRLRNPPFLFLELRSYGPSISFPWGFTTKKSDDANILETFAKEAALVIHGIRGTKYKVGSSSQIRQIASGSITDWVKGIIQVPFVYTIELPPGGSGFDPPAKDIKPIVKETFEAIKFLARAVLLV